MARNSNFHSPRDTFIKISVGLDTEMTGPTLGSDMSGSFQFGSRSAEVLVRSQSYQLLMKSLACQLQSRDSVCVCKLLYGGSVMLNQNISQTENMFLFKYCLPLSLLKTI